MSEPIARLCADHLNAEEHLLAAALPIVQTIQGNLGGTAPMALPELAERHDGFTRLLPGTATASAAAARSWAAGSAWRRAVRLSRPVLARLSGDAAVALTAQLAHVRNMADQLVAANHRLSVHLRIHLDAYQSLLHDLTGTAPSSGRYGPHGKAETQIYRPLIQIRG